MSDNELAHAEAVLNGLANIYVGSLCWKRNSEGTPSELVVVRAIDNQGGAVVTGRQTFLTRTYLLTPCTVN